MQARHPSLSFALPALWLLTDARNDAVLEEALLRMPRRSGVVFRHYHLAPDERHRRFSQVARTARTRGHSVILSGRPRLARRWGADGAYGSPGGLARGGRLVRLATVHSLREIAAATRARANAVLLSPVFATRSHPGVRAFGPVRFRLLARQSRVPVIALGGMTRARSRRLAGFAWAAIDGLSF